MNSSKVNLVQTKTCKEQKFYQSLLEKLINLNKNKEE